MITNKDIRVENGFLIINGDKYPLDGQSPEAIMEIVEDNSDTTPTENSDAPITSGGVYTALGAKQDTLTFDTTPTDESTNPVTSGGVYTAIDDIVSTKTGAFTLDQTQSGANKNGLLIKQSGNVVSIQGFISGLTLTAGTSTVIGVVSGVSLPPTGLRLMLNQTTAAYTMGDTIYGFFSNETGNLSIVPKTTSDTLNISITYVV